MSKKKATKPKAKGKPKGKPKVSTPLIVDRRRLAAILGISTRHFAELEAEGVIVPLSRGRGGRASTYAIESSVPAYLRHVTSAPASGKEREARTRKYMGDARFVELKNAKEEGLLIPVEEVILAGQQQVKSWTAKIRALPRQMVQTGVIPREKEPRVAEMLHHLLHEIATWKPAESREAS